MDLLEKLAHEHADWVQPHKRLFIGPLADSDQWEIRLQVVRALPLLQGHRASDGVSSRFSSETSNTRSHLCGPGGLTVWRDSPRGTARYFLR